MEERRKIGGAIWEITVKGNFATVDSYGVISLSSLEQCKDLKVPWRMGRHIGIDVALTGDFCYAVLVEDGVVIDTEKWHDPNLMGTVGHIVDLVDRWKPDKWESVHVDRTGLGEGVVSRLHELGHPCDGVSNAESPEFPTEYSEFMPADIKFKNRRAENFFILKFMLLNKKFCIPKEYAEAWDDLTAAKFGYASTGEMLIIPKEKIKEILGRSPDFGDSILLTFSRYAEGPQLRMI